MAKKITMKGINDMITSKFSEEEMREGMMNVFGFTRDEVIELEKRNKNKSN